MYLGDESLHARDDLDHSLELDQAGMDLTDLTNIQLRGETVPHARISEWMVHDYCNNQAEEEKKIKYSIGKTLKNSNI